MKTNLKTGIALSLLLLAACGGNRTTNQAKPPLDRPPLLVPGAVPKDVRYRYEKDAKVVRVAQELTDKLAVGSRAKLFDKVAMIFPGAWKVFGESGRLGKADSFPISVIAPGVGNFEGRGLRDAAAMATLAGDLRARLAEDGGFVLRALTTREMELWWIFIPFDIEEPIYIAETKKGRYRFVLNVDDNGSLTVLDELNVLHAASDPTAAGM